MPKEDQAAFDAAKYGKFPGAVFLDVNDLNLNDARVLLKHIGSAGWTDVTKHGRANSNRAAQLFNASYSQGGQEVAAEVGPSQANVGPEQFDEADPAYVRKPAVYAAIAKWKEWQATAKTPGAHHGHGR